MIVVVMVALGMAVFAAVLFGVWWLDRLIKNEGDALREAAVDQSRRLASVSTELHYARAELTRVHSLVGTLRAELEAFVHGPPSIRSRPQQAS